MEPNVILRVGLTPRALTYTQVPDRYCSFAIASGFQPRPHRSIRLARPQPECRAGMCDRQHSDGNYNHWTLKYHECNLIVCDGATETAAQLCDTEHAADEDGDGGNRQCY